MNFQINNSIKIIFFIYILSFYQINCDNNTINSNVSSNNNSKTTSNLTITGNEEVQAQKPKIIKKDNPKLNSLEDSLHAMNGSDETKQPSGKTGKSRNKILNDANNTIIPVYNKNNMTLTTFNPLKITNTTVSSGEVVESGKQNIITTNITTIATTPKPAKPLITFSTDELPETVVQPSGTKTVQSSSNTTINNEVTLNMTTPSNITSLNSTAAAAPTTTTTLHSVEDLDRPKVQYSKEPIPTITSKRDYIIPVVALIFAIPIVLAIATIMYRRAKDYWETRHYRRMDFLIDEMYND